MLALGALAIWLGVHALRSYTAMSVWNLADEIPLQLKPVPPLLVHAIGLLGWPARRVLGGSRPLIRFGIAFALATALRQLLGDFDRAAIAAAMLAWILFLWWLPCYLESLSRLQRRVVLPMAAVLGISLQVGGQTLLHGLDVPMLRGMGGWVVALSMASAFVVLNQRAAALPEDSPAEPMGRGAIALIGGWLFLEISLLANLGRIAHTRDLDLVTTSILIQSGLIAGLLISGLAWRGKRLLAAGALFLLLPLMSGAGGPDAWMMVVAHAASVVVLVAACTRGRTTSKSYTYHGWLFGSALLFVFLFGFYSRFEAPLIWTIAGMPLVLLSLGAGDDRIARAPRLAVVIAGVALVTCMGSLIPATGSFSDPERGPGLRVLTYNIHQGFDAAALPAMQRIANEIGNTDADVVALQEISRGWDLLGGADLVAYLRWRLPEYHVVFTSTNGLWGSAMLSRLAPLASAGGVFEANANFRYGYTQVDVGTRSLPLHIFSVHLSADLEAGGDSIRNLQALELARKTSDITTIVAGDFNAEPNTPVVQALLNDGLIDVAAGLGLGNAPTWPAHSPVNRLDYIFATPDLQPVKARLLRTTASDHLPVVVDFSLVPARREIP